MNEKKPYILVTNDDGINAPGINALVLQLRKIGDVIVVAPDTERSAVGHAITLSDPLRVVNFSKNGIWSGFGVSGTPADCVKIAVNALLDRKPDIIVSGINLGSNTGINVIYSGTVSAATEGTILGIPSIAISLTTYIDPIFETPGKFARNIVKLVLEKGLPDGTLLNINVPNLYESEIKGIAITRQGRARFAEVFDKRIDPKNKVYYWLAGSKEEMQEAEDVDDEAIKRNEISITPIKYDLSDYEFMRELKNWVKQLDI
jgi:5'-nucleotidase